MPRRVNLTEWARINGVSKSTAHQWYRDGKIPSRTEKVGRLILVDLPDDEPTQPSKTAVYARVSSSDQRDDLDRQVSRVVEWATSHGYSVDVVVREVGSGLNGRRPKFKRLLSDPSISTIIAESRDRLARFGSEHVEAALAARDAEVVITSDDEIDDDLVRDVTDLLTSICARRYGRRSARNRAERAVREMERDDD